MIGDTLRPIAEDVARAMDVTLPELYSTRRHKTLVAARHTAIWLASRCTPYPLSVIARHFMRDRTSVEHAIEMVNKQRAQDTALAEKLKRLQARHTMTI